MAQDDIIDDVRPCADTQTSAPAMGDADHVAAGATRRPFKINTQLVVTVVQAVDAAVIALAATAGVGIGAPDWFLLAPLWLVAPFVGGALVLAWAVWVFGRFRIDDGETIGAHLSKTAAGLALATIVIAIALAPFDPSRAFTMGVALMAGGASAGVLGFHAVAASLVRRWRAAGRFAQDAVIVGSGPAVRRMILAGREKGDLNAIAVFVTDRAEAPDEVAGVEVLGDIDDLLSWRELPAAGKIVISADTIAAPRLREIADRLRALPNNVALALDLSGVAPEQPAVELTAQTPLAYVSGRPGCDTHALAKRAQDLVLGVPLLIAFLPAMAAIALAVKLTSPGPVFFRQRRHGFNNRVISVWKFRTMRHRPAEHGPIRQVVDNDARVTKLGRVLRATSLDELPQLINVVKGEMSLVGPRPHALAMRSGDAETASLVEAYAHRHRVKPGITGWAQINGSRGPLHTPEEVRRRIALDMAYVERASFWLDMWILLRTAPSLLGDAENTR